MVLVCRDKTDSNPSYNEVIDWLIYKGTEVKFLSGQDFYKNGSNWFVFLNDKEDTYSLSTSSNMSIWFRGFLNHRNHFRNTLHHLNSTNDNINELRRRIGQEMAKVNAQIYSKYDSAYQLPKFSALKIDKFSTLKKAKSIGLKIPTSIITNSKKELTVFINKHKEVITKPLHESIFFEEEKYIIFSNTMKITLGILQEIREETFFPSLFQEYIEKDIELRIFYIEGEFFSMAIFSQLDPQTKTDFRNYNTDNPNRNVPYILPKTIEDKLHTLMLELDLNTGSIDMIKTPNKEYIFLEVNPTGQFGFTSKPCNYFLEEKIANTLIKNQK